MTVLTVITVFIASVFAYLYVTEPIKLNDTTYVVIKPGSSFSSITHTLTEKGIVSTPLFFRILAKVTGQETQAKAGEYAFEPGITRPEILKKLSSGDSHTRSITIPEGYTTAQIKQLLTENQFLSGEITLDITEGQLLPETYHFSRGDTRDSVLKRMQKAMKAVVSQLWPNRKSDLPIQNTHEMLTLASIVEKETGQHSERARVAAVYINRLRVNMLLQADPTVSYGITLGKQDLEKPLTYKDLRTDHPYNTYTRPGLPPGPIANPGKAAIEAVLNPLETKELYFVADGTGGHRFAKTLKEHNKNVRHWRKVQKTLE